MGPRRPEAADWLAGAAVALTIVVVGAIAVEHDPDAVVRLSRAEWACSRTHPERRLRLDPLPEGGSVAEVVSEPVCDAWVRR